MGKNSLGAEEKSSCFSKTNRQTLLVLAAFLRATLNFGHAEVPDQTPGRILVQPKASLSEAAVKSLLGQLGGMQVGAIPQINLRIVRVPDQRQQTILDALQHNPNIQFAEPDYLLKPTTVTPNDPYYAQEYHLTKIAAPSAWDYSVGSGSVTIAILDSGIDSTHPDLAPLIVPGWNFYDNNADLTDVTGHGTAVAGVAAALGNNGAGVAAVTWGCRLMPLRIASTTGSASSSACANALTWAADHGARVANISYGNVTKITAINTAAQYFQSKGGVVTASAGNAGTFDSTAENPLFLLMSATDQNDVLATWSCTGNNIDLAAPGVNVVTTASGGGYASGSGTSFSAPIVAGVAALVISANPNLSATQVQDILKQNADDLGPAGWDTSYGAGRVNAAKALAAATGIPITPADTTPPAVSIGSPLAGAVVSGTASVAVSASDNIAVAKVEWYMDGILKSSSSSANAVFSWDTTSTANGNHSLAAKAYDAAGNIGTSAALTVTVNNPLPDTTAPLATVSAPLSGATVSGSTSVMVSGSDNVGVTKIEWYLDGALKGSIASALGTFAWDTTVAANGNHSVAAKAYDAAGNMGTSALVTVSVNNPVPDTTAPTSTISSPASGTTVSGTVNVNLSGSDNVGVTKLELYVDGALTSTTSASSSGVYAWDTTKSVNGSHSLVAKAYDAAGNVGASATVTVTVSNMAADTTAPTVQITSPTTGTKVSKTVKINVSASDNVGVSRIDLYIDGALYQSATTSTASFSWSTTKVAAGNHTLQAFASDAAGNNGSSAILTVSK